MLRFTDGKRISEVEFLIWKDSPFQDCTAEVCGVEKLKYDKAVRAYKVEDINDLVEKASAWEAESSDHVANMYMREIEKDA